jgi:hypothetical protein
MTDPRMILSGMAGSAMAELDKYQRAMGALVAAKIARDQVAQQRMWPSRKRAALAAADRQLAVAFASARKLLEGR